MSMTIESLNHKVVMFGGCICSPLGCLERSSKSEIVKRYNFISKGIFNSHGSFLDILSSVSEHEPYHSLKSVEVYVNHWLD